MDEASCTRISKSLLLTGLLHSIMKISYARPRTYMMANREIKEAAITIQGHPAPRFRTAPRFRPLAIFRSRTPVQSLIFRKAYCTPLGLFKNLFIVLHPLIYRVSDSEQPILEPFFFLPSDATIPTHMCHGFGRPSEANATLFGSRETRSRLLRIL